MNLNVNEMNDLIFWSVVYFAIGALTMLSFDLMHYATRNMQSEEDYNDNSFNNFERIYVMVSWPIVLVALIRRLIKEMIS